MCVNVVARESAEKVLRGVVRYKRVPADEGDQTGGGDGGEGAEGERLSDEQYLLGKVEIFNQLRSFSSSGSEYRE